MRALRNLNPRYRADSWLPAGTTIRATTRITGLYKRYCVDGARAELAQQLVMSDPAAAVVHAGDTGPATGSPTVTAMVPGPTKIATRSEEHKSELQSLMSISYAVFCLK